MKNKSNIPEWLLNENEQRSGEYKRNISEEYFLRIFNDKLADIENEMVIDDNTEYPIVYFFGLPRCGKTIFSQLLSYALDIWYPNNFIARFWDAPTVGSQLYNIIYKNFESNSSFASDYGKTKSITDPHDFAYFWHKWLRMDEFPYDPQTNKNKIDWNGLFKQLKRIMSFSKKALLFKAVNPSYHLSTLIDKYPKSLVVFLERDLIDTAVSLRKGRLDNYQNLNNWYGQHPLPNDYYKIKDLPYNEQIGGQFKYLLEMYENHFSQINSENIIKISYNEFCEKPNEIIETIFKRVKLISGYEIPIVNKIDSDVIKYSTHSPDLPFYKELVSGIEKYGLKIR